MKTFIKKHSVPSYYVLTFAISWVGVLLVIGGPGRIPGTPEETTKLFPTVYLVTVAGPSLGGILMTGLISGKAGIRELLSRLLRWRVGARWYAVALLTPALSVLATLLALSLLSPEFLPGFLTMSAGTSSLQLSFGTILVLGLATGLLEELGWTGFAIPRLRLRHGVFTTGLLVGFLWGAWHFLSNAWASNSTEPVPVALFLPAILFSFLPPFRMLMVWIYDRTRSLLLGVLMHASLVTFWLVSTPKAMSSAALVTWYIAWAAVLWAAVGLVAAANRGQLARRPRRSRADELSLINRRAA
jgi:uncharacterized protein